jgi:hypothetical protein
VDWVTEEARRAGRGAARYVSGQLREGEADLVTRAGAGVRYVVPQKIRIGNLEQAVELMLRVSDPFQDKWLVARQGGTLVHRVRKPHLTPGEMESLRIPVAKLQGLGGELTLGLEEVTHEA